MFAARLLFALALTIVAGLFPAAPSARAMAGDADNQGFDCLAGAGTTDMLVVQAGPATGNELRADRKADVGRLAPCHDPDSPNGCTLAPTCVSSCLAATLSDPAEFISHREAMTETPQQPRWIGLSHIPAIRPPISLI